MIYETHSPSDYWSNLHLVDQYATVVQHYHKGRILVDNRHKFNFFIDW